MNLLVAALYGPSVRNSIWRRLQMNFLNLTSSASPCRVDVAYFLNRCDPVPFGDAVRSNKSDVLPCEKAKALLLREALSYFLTRSSYDYYLVLDSDAFPIRTCWLDRLLNNMRLTTSSGKRCYASAVRLENGEAFPDPSVLFIDGHFLRSLPHPLSYFDSRPLDVSNVFGQSVCRSGTAFFRDGWTPLPRTNVANLHPVLGGIYGGLFYHHNCGSGVVDLESINSGLYSSSTERFTNASADSTLFEWLATDPSALIKHLAGVTEGSL